MQLLFHSKYAYNISHHLISSFYMPGCSSKVSVFLLRGVFPVSVSALLSLALHSFFHFDVQMKNWNLLVVIASVYSEPPQAHGFEPWKLGSLQEVDWAAKVGHWGWNLRGYN